MTDEWPDYCTMRGCRGQGPEHDCIVIYRSFESGNVRMRVEHHWRAKVGWVASIGRSRGFGGADRRAYRLARDAARRAAEQPNATIVDAFGAWGLDSSLHRHLTQGASR